MGLRWARRFARIGSGQRFPRGQAPFRSPNGEVLARGALRAMESSGSALWGQAPTPPGGDLPVPAPLGRDPDYLVASMTVVRSGVREPERDDRHSSPPAKGHSTAPGEFSESAACRYDSS
jgi:hypothetical protein